MYRHILAAVDFSDSADSALSKSIDLALQLGANLTFVHVVVSEDTPTPMYTQHEVRARIRDAEAQRDANVQSDAGAPRVRAPIEIGFYVRVGDPAEQILDAARVLGADLIVLSSKHEQSTLSWLTGTTGERLARRHTCDLLLC